MSAPPRRMYLDPTDDDARRLFQRGIEGPLLMLNLLRFREIADYSDFPDLAPPEPISGSAASDRYVRHTLPFLAASGGRSSSMEREVTRLSARPTSVGIA